MNDADAPEPSRRFVDSSVERMLAIELALQELVSPTTCYPEGDLEQLRVDWARPGIEPTHFT